MLLLFLLSTLGVLALVGVFARHWTLGERLAAAVPLGNLLLGLLGLALASGFGMTPVALGLATVLSFSPALVWLRLGPRRRLLRVASVSLSRVGNQLRKPGKSAVALTLWYTVLFAFLLRFFWGACYADADGAIWTLNVANLGDLPLHIGIVKGFAVGGNFPPEHPALEGAKLTYPFIVDFTAALFVKAGASVPSAFFFQNATLIACTLYWLWRLTRLFTRDALAAHLALPLALFCGGWGFLYFGGDWQAASGKGLGEFLLDLPKSYTNDAERSLRWGNMLCVLLGTQRSIVLGMPLALTVVRLWWDGKRRGMWLAGLLVGLLPLGHIHTFASLAGVAVLQALGAVRYSGFKVALSRWLPFFALLALGAAASLAYMLLGSATHTENFRRFALGWDGGATDVLGWARFWLFNTGPFIPLLVLAASRAPRRLLLFYLPFLVCFFGPNIVQMAPWIWDNLKVLIYWYLLSVPLVAGLLASWLKTPGLRVWAPFVLLCCITAGAIDAWHVATGSGKQQIFSPQEQRFGDAILAATPPHARILTAPAYIHPVYWAGRRMWLGYPGWLASHGLVYKYREDAMLAIYTAASPPEAEALLKKYEIDYVAVTPRERGDIPSHSDNSKRLPLDENFFRQRYPVAAQQGEYLLYKIR
nr:hypothetical protein [Armatimonas sp.]